MEKFEAIELCKKHMHRYVRATMSDGSVYDGFVESVDEEKLYLAVPVGHENVSPVSMSPNANVAPTYVSPASVNANVAPTYVSPASMSPNANVAPTYVSPASVSPNANVAPTYVSPASVSPNANVSPMFMSPANMSPNVAPAVMPEFHHDCFHPCGGYPGYDYRAFFPGFYPPFGYGYGFGYPFYGPRFNRLILPLVGLTALSLLPFY
ncbi:hypothetical protein [Paenibacillus sp. XY044]|uniref:hypothetical protein n=1 Tax=Paenibacillus sp. XY044 TaxID=2026089 RepID=UPI000B9870D6|nr:hypothetical protein [Paenibacillus sp. XY044]OZB91672.1 hypothetical protein CJP46_26900 [Paenibacillus sp. XY044]